MHLIIHQAYVLENVTANFHHLIDKLLKKDPLERIKWDVSEESSSSF